MKIDNFIKVHLLDKYCQRETSLVCLVFFIYLDTTFFNKIPNLKVIMTNIVVHWSSLHTILIEEQFRL